MKTDSILDVIHRDGKKQLTQLKRIGLALINKRFLPTHIGKIRPDRGDQ
jgi:hypothetical protein